MVSAMVPWNLVTLPLIPFYLCGKKSSKLNETVLHISYIPNLIFLFPCFLAYNFLMLPFAYVMGIARKVYQLGNKRN